MCVCALEKPTLSLRSEGEQRTGFLVLWQSETERHVGRKGWSWGCRAHPAPGCVRRGSCAPGEGELSREDRSALCSGAWGQCSPRPAGAGRLFRRIQQPVQSASALAAATRLPAAAAPSSSRPPGDCAHCILATLSPHTMTPYSSRVTNGYPRAWQSSLACKCLLMSQSRKKEQM